MIDHRRKFIFVENPKTATYSIKRALVGDENLKNPNDPRVGTSNHNIPRVIKAIYPAEWRRYTKFVVVRNTWDRAHSFFEFYRNVAGSASYQSMAFDEWVAAGTPPPEEDHLRGPMRSDGRFDDVLCQLRYTREVDEIIVLHSFDHQRRCMELKAGIERVCALLGITVPSIPTDGNRHGRSTRPITWKRETIDSLGLNMRKR